MKRIEGVNVAAVTPHGANGRDPDFGATLDLIDFLSRAGVRGIALLGSTGEFLNLDIEERGRLVYLATKRSTVPVLAGVAHSTLDGAVELGREACSAGAAGLLLMPPYFFRYGQAEIREFYLRFARQMGPNVPVYLYNIPFFTSELACDTAVELLSTGLFAGIKDSSGSFEYFERLKELPRHGAGGQRRRLHARALRGRPWRRERGGVRGAGVDAGSRPRDSGGGCRGHRKAGGAPPGVHRLAATAFQRRSGSRWRWPCGGSRPGRSPCRWRRTTSAVSKNSRNGSKPGCRRCSGNPPVRRWLLLPLAAAAAQAQPQALTFLSAVDDTDQPYALYLPKTFDPARKYPLVVSLHDAGSNHRLNLRRVFGRGAPGPKRAAEAGQLLPAAAATWISSSRRPFARGTMGYEGIAEQDVYDVLADVKRRFPSTRTAST